MKRLAVLCVLMSIPVNAESSEEKALFETATLKNERVTLNETPALDLTVKPSPKPVEETLFYPTETPEYETEKEPQDSEPVWYRDKYTVGGIHDRQRDQQPWQKDGK